MVAWRLHGIQRGDIEPADGSKGNWQMIDFAHARKTMVDNQLRTSSLTDRRVLNAMGKVPRELFVPEARRDLAYIDEAQPFAGYGVAARYLSAPVPFARLVQLAAIAATDKVLDVGAGTGYSTAVIAELAAYVIGVEADAALAERGRDTLARLGITNAEILEAAFETGVPASGPYDVIMIEGSIAAVPKTLLDQLRDGGRVAALIRNGKTSVAHLYLKTGKAITSQAGFDAGMPSILTDKTSGNFVF
ncbi:MAG: Protein-L-isoaspartate O-methyltransferase [Devosia sp.]|nr:Protein-L-isoaspartate O-methyltransferase [Devosia sp.]